MLVAFLLTSILMAALCRYTFPIRPMLGFLRDVRGAVGDPPGTGEPPKVLDADAVAQIVAQTVNARFKSLKKEVTEAIAQDFGKQMETYTKSIGEQIASLSTGKKGKGGKVDDEGAPDPDNSPAMRTMQKQMEDLKASNAKLTTERQQEVDRNRSMQMRSKLREQLEQHGITEPHRVKAVSAILIDAEKRIAWDEESNDFVFKDTDGGDLELATGVKAWVTSEEGQNFIPPAGAGGSGGKPSTRKTTTPNTEPSKADIGMALLKQFGSVG